jgi:prevent-host-death family protein
VKHTWQLQEAKAKLSEVIDLAASGEVQVITRRGQKAAVVMSHDEYLQLRQASRTLLEALSGAPKGELLIHRDKTPVKAMRFE